MNRYNSKFWNEIEFWKMTKAEYEAKYGKLKTKGAGATTGTGGFSPHKSAVEVAINKGLPVPENVLKDYPDLKSNAVSAKLLGSSPDLENMKKLIAKYWYAKPENIEIKGEEVYQGGKKMDNVRVIQSKGRFRFERI